MEARPARGSGLYPLRRQISAARQVRLLHPLPNFAPVVQRTRIVGLHPTDAGSTTERRTNAGLARRSSPRSIIARRWFDSDILHHFCFAARVTGRDGSCTRLLIETRLVRFQRHPPKFAGLADMDIHSPFKRDKLRSIPTSRTRVTLQRGGIA